MAKGFRNKQTIINMFFVEATCIFSYKSYTYMPTDLYNLDNKI